MGISTLASYKGSQQFEVLGMSDEVVDSCFKGTASRIGGVTFTQLGKDALHLHSLAYGTKYSDDSVDAKMLPNPGDYHYRGGPDAEKHLNDPEAIAKLQAAAQGNNRELFRQFSLVNTELSKQIHLRGLLKFKTTAQGVPLSEVEPAASIVKRFVTGAMSYGSIRSGPHSSPPLLLTLLSLPLQHAALRPIPPSLWL